ncbi:MAG: CDP-diacylglycerol--serine O-phosphatidyltransferase [Elusimicrobiaceae bacterium]|nr:CDP-diacylglycerol--serine O-phosphatidyltransferase [Elusimicrobiaceae bacterium]
MNLQNLKQTGRVALPSLFTIASIAFGFFSILSAVDNEYSRAGWFIIFAMVMDGLDGRVARMVKGESSFGVEMDSLADFLSFGVAPSLLMYFFLLDDFGFWGYPVAFCYTMCGAMRLAYFNVLAHEGRSSKKYFSGLPVPMAAGILASFVICYSLLEVNVATRSSVLFQYIMPWLFNLMPFVMLALALLMVSKVPYPAFKQGTVLRPRSIRALLFLVALIFMVIRYPQDSIFLLFATYVASGLAVFMWHLFAGMPPAPKEEHPPA